MEDLIQVLEEAKSWLSKPENTFGYSSVWEDSSMACEDIDQFIQDLKDRVEFKVIDLKILFAPTGPIQEISIYSGWGKEFLLLADRFDKALLLYRTRS